jgi:hypothetical protein
MVMAELQVLLQNMETESHHSLSFSKEESEET